MRPSPWKCSRTTRVQRPAICMRHSICHLPVWSDNWREHSPREARNEERKTCRQSTVSGGSNNEMKETPDEHTWQETYLDTIPNTSRRNDRHESHYKGTIAGSLIHKYTTAGCEQIRSN